MKIPQVKQHKNQVNIPDFVRSSFCDLFFAERDDVVIVTSLISSLLQTKRRLVNNFQEQNHLRLGVWASSLCLLKQWVVHE